MIPSCQLKTNNTIMCKHNIIYTSRVYKLNVYMIHGCQFKMLKKEYSVLLHTIIPEKSCIFNTNWHAPLYRRIHGRKWLNRIIEKIQTLEFQEKKRFCRSSLECIYLQIFIKPCQLRRHSGEWKTYRQRTIHFAFLVLIRLKTSQKKFQRNPKKKNRWKLLQNNMLRWEWEPSESIIAWKFIKTF